MTRGSKLPKLVYTYLYTVRETWVDEGVVGGRIVVELRTVKRTCIVHFFGLKNIKKKRMKERKENQRRIRR
jgi:hypothetical protein